MLLEMAFPQRLLEVSQQYRAWNVQTQLLLRCLLIVLAFAAAAHPHEYLHPLIVMTPACLVEVAKR